MFTLYLSMDQEIIFTTEKPVTKQEIEDFRVFKKDVKSLLKKGKLKSFKFRENQKH